MKPINDDKIGNEKGENMCDMSIIFINFPRESNSGDTRQEVVYP